MNRATEIAMILTLYYVLKLASMTLIFICFDSSVHIIRNVIFIIIKLIHVDNLFIFIDYQTYLLGYTSAAINIYNMTSPCVFLVVPYLQYLNSPDPQET